MFGNWFGVPFNMTSVHRKILSLYNAITRYVTDIMTVHETNKEHILE